MIIENKGKLTFAFAHGGLPEIADYIEHTPRVWGKHYDASTDKGTSPARAWDLEAGWQGALDIAATGWHDGAEALASNLQGVRLPANGARRKHSWGVAGSRVHVPKMLAGNPRCMKKRGARSGYAPTVSIVVNMAASAGVQARHYRAYGLAIAALVLWLERSGTRVHLDAVMGVEFAKGTHLAGWNVKRASDPMDESAVAFTLAHPAAFRRIGFAMIERSPKRFETMGYGRPKALTERHCEALGLQRGTMIMAGIGQRFDQLERTSDALAMVARDFNAACPEGAAVDESAFMESAEA